MRKFKLVVAILLIITGVFLGFYVGAYICLVGGITGIINAVTFIIAGTNGAASLMAWSIVKILLAGAAGGLSAYACIIPAIAIILHGK